MKDLAGHVLQLKPVSSELNIYKKQKHEKHGKETTLLCHQPRHFEKYSKWPFLFLYDIDALKIVKKERMWII